MSIPDPESVSVQLARMEGSIHLILQRMDDLVPRVLTLEAVTGELKSTTQRLDLEAKARDATAVALAVALKDAKEATEAAQRQEAAKEQARDGKSWSPIQRLVLVAGAISTVVAIWQAIRPS